MQVATDAAFTKGKKTSTVASGATLRKKVTGLTSGATYYVRVRAYKTIDGTKAYGSWSAARTATVK